MQQQLLLENIDCEYLVLFVIKVMAVTNLYFGGILFRRRILEVCVIVRGAHLCEMDGICPTDIIIINLLCMNDWVAEEKGN